MAVPGKKGYLVYLDQKNVETLRRYLSDRPDAGGLSGLLDKYVTRCAAIIEKNPDALKEIEPGKMTVKRFIQLAKLNV